MWVSCWGDLQRTENPQWFITDTEENKKVHLLRYNLEVPVLYLIISVLQDAIYFYILYQILEENITQLHLSDLFSYNLLFKVKFHIKNTTEF